MLTQLSIHGLAIIEELHINFSPHLNVITGETGAGKSILIKALHLLLGAKADPDVIRRGFSRAHVSAAFVLPKQHSVVVLLESHGLWHDDQDLTELIIRREIAQKTKSQAWINDQPITLSLLKELGHSLIDIYGQHENHRMLDPLTHLDYIDEFIIDQSLKTRLYFLMLQAQQFIQELKRRLDVFNQRRREQDYLQFRWNELTTFAPSLDEYTKLVRICQNLGRRLSDKRVFDQAQQICDEGYHGRSLSSALQELIKVLDATAKERQDLTLQANLEQLQGLAISIDELSYHLGRCTQSEEFDEEELEHAQSRVAGYQALTRKLGVHSVEEILVEFQRLEQEMSGGQCAPEEMSELLRQIYNFLIEADALARQLAKSRRDAARTAVQTIERELHDLNMKGARIEFDFQNVQISVPEINLDGLGIDLHNLWLLCEKILKETTKNGRERGQFMLAANPGDNLKPLAKVASGGEISRIMLGFKKALAMGANTCVMVFDEIDTGISGHTAHIVGKKLKELSSSFQVICISHLPQVAAYGDAHFLVEKAQVGDKAESRMLKLNRKASEEEIARLLSGDQVTSSSLTHARQLLKAAREKSSASL